MAAQVNSKDSEETTVSLCDLKVGERAIVRTVKGRNNVLRNKLLSMGLVAGTAIELLRVAPLGDPIQIQALGYRLSLRLNEAKSVEVVPFSLN